ncbi:MAG: HupE/UreJ family protein [Roseibacillus sp.]
MTHLRSLASLLVGFLWVSILPIAQGHIIDQVYAELRTQGTGFEVKMVIDAGYCLPEYRGDKNEKAPDSAWINGLDEEEHARLRREAESYLRKTLTFFQNSEEVAYEITFEDYAQEPYKFYESMFGAPTLRLNLKAEFLPAGGELRASWQDPYEAILLFVVKIRTEERRENISIPIEPKTEKKLGIHVEPFLAPDNSSSEVLEGRATNPLSKRTVTTTSKPLGWLDFVKLGFRHVIPQGLDHILFVVGLFLFSPKWRPLLHQSLAFTVAHSVTLALSLTGLVGFSGKWVEALIALSIVYVAVENLRTQEEEKVEWPRLFLIFGFGLLHGLGFGAMLRFFMPSQDVIAPVIGFNVGVELGQIAVLAVCFLLFGWFTKQFKWIRIPGSVVIGLAGLIWFFERALA